MKKKMITINITHRFIWNNVNMKKKEIKNTKHIKEKKLFPNSYDENDDDASGSTDSE